jgi:Protein of unknown function (DUF3568)
MRTLTLLMMCLSLTGCAALAAGLASVGAGYGVGNYVSGTNYRTFTEPLPKVRTATLTAFERMAIKVNSTEKTKAGEVLKATAKDRRIEVELEVITPNATRMRSVAKHQGGVLLDQATGLEIVVQTEKALSRAAVRTGRPETLSPQRPSRRVLAIAGAEEKSTKGVQAQASK